MNHIYNTFLDKNLLSLLDIYQKEIKAYQKGLLVIKIDASNKIDVFFQPQKHIDPLIKQEIKQIQTRSERLLSKDRHVLTCASQPTPFPIQEVFFLITSPDQSYLLRGYQQSLNPDADAQIYTFEFETFMEKADGAVQLEDGSTLEPKNLNFKGKWMIQNTDAGQKYLRLCRKALQDPQVFANFRQPLDYQNILIGGDDERAEKYMQLLQIDSPSEPIQTIRHTLQACDRVGNPPITSAGFSTYTLRCYHTLQDLQAQFGPDGLTHKRIVEIGSGHGGLCHVISSFIDYKDYTLIDLPAVNLLAEKYFEEVLSASAEKYFEEVLSAQQLENKKIRFMDTEQIIPRKYDLLISEYALSELDLTAQKYYLENVIKYCQTAYLAMNIWDPLRKADFKARLGQIFSKIEEFPEIPPSNYPNYIWICQR